MEFNVDNLKGTLIYNLRSIIIEAMVPMGDENTLHFRHISIDFISLFTILETWISLTA